MFDKRRQIIKIAIFVATELYSNHHSDIYKKWKILFDTTAANCQQNDLICHFLMLIQNKFRHLIHDAQKCSSREVLSISQSAKYYEHQFAKPKKKFIIILQNYLQKPINERHTAYIPTERVNISWRSLSSSSNQPNNFLINWY